MLNSRLTDQNWFWPELCDQSWLGSLTSSWDEFRPFSKKFRPFSKKFLRRLIYFRALQSGMQSTVQPHLLQNRLKTHQISLAGHLQHHTQPQPLLLKPLLPFLAPQCFRYKCSITILWCYRNSCLSQVFISGLYKCHRRVRRIVFGRQLCHHIWSGVPFGWYYSGCDD